MYDLFYSTFLGPLGKEYCNLFLISTIIYILFILGAIMEKIYSIVMGKSNIKSIIQFLYFLIPVLYGYIMNRILYGICIHTSK